MNNTTESDAKVSALEAFFPSDEELTASLPLNETSPMRDFFYEMASAMADARSLMQR